MPTKIDETPAVGTDIWFRMPLDPNHGEWRPGKVVDKIDGAGVPEHLRALEPPYEGTIHLYFDVDRRRHHAASAKAYRYNVERGTEPGQWWHEKPAGADEDLERRRKEKDDLVKLRQEMMRERSGNSRGQAPKNPVEGR